MKLKNVSSNLWNIKKNVMVKDVMSTKVYSLEKTSPVQKAIDMMGNESISAIVISDDKKPIGIVTERDLIKKVMLPKKDPKKMKIGSIMSENPKKISPNATMLMASNYMKRTNVRKLVVVDDSGKLVGMLSQTDIIQSMNEIYESYKSLLWNPWYPLWIVFVILILYLFTFILRIYIK